MRFIIADDHAIFRTGLKLLLGQLPGWQLQAEAGDAASLKALLQQHEADVLIMDYHMPGDDSMAVLGYLKQRHPGLRVLMLTAAQSGGLLQQLLDQGADGLALKDEAPEVMLDAARSVAAGRRYLSPLARERLQDAGIELTARESQLLQLICAGQSSVEIAERLALSARTVDKHREHIFRKLDVNNVAQLLNKARLLGLLDARL
ncbi:two component transcriptional regulator, LuxR family [Andreprevotia lacus DSM 23236]|jgi:DNA-binding NarL/FixJ family response regulator|uniref:Two component transcriptional regulator, LuxR family n=1 Tax=Andreprevotia lacus DSM 23236 TaxID=1121001 RepID=A0A1W1XWI6_9NEIS|nr:response regulator transcription factor [Andreprevotia lacus]SMC27878.1 two component transcriptional regulator, LuxR family [Andreprevotia lacus DSM 23236]